jgi:hypothetical protein
MPAANQPPMQSELSDERRATAILEMVCDASFELDSTAIITGWNSRAEKLFRWPSLDAI